VDEPVPLYALPPVSLDDVRQERALAALEGKVVHRSRFAYQRRDREYGYGLTPQDDWQSPFAPPAPDPAVVESLITWVMSQERHVAVRVMDYLDSPSPELLERVKEVIDVGMTLETHRQVREVTLTDLICRALPANMTTLYELARREHMSRRPEAAVRQIIRNLRKRGAIDMDSEEMWHAVQRG